MDSKSVINGLLKKVKNDKAEEKTEKPAARKVKKAIKRKARKK